MDIYNQNYIIINVLFRIIEKYRSDSVDIVPIIIYTISEREV